MCGRYKLQNPDWVEADFSNTFPTLASAVRRPRFNIAPGQLVMALTAAPGGRNLEQMKWGIKAGWKGGPSQLINARGEKLQTSRLWKPMLEHGRCAIPADGFYEWKAAAQTGARKRPYLFTRNGGVGFWLAGVFRATGDTESLAEHECAIVTTSPNELVEGVHDRMPAMLSADQLDHWLGGDADEAASVLGPFPSTLMSATAISTAIGNASREGPELIEPLATQEPLTG
jgi:putative SOS response-associated peptidase YedK